MANKAYKVKVSFEYFVAAENERSAEDQAVKEFVAKSNLRPWKLSVKATEEKE